MSAILLKTVSSITWLLSDELTEMLRRQLDDQAASNPRFRIDSQLTQRVVATVLMLLVTMAQPRAVEFSKRLASYQRSGLPAALAAQRARTGWSLRSSSGDEMTEFCFCCDYISIQSLKQCQQLGSASVGRHCTDGCIYEDLLSMLDEAVGEAKPGRVRKFAKSLSASQAAVLDNYLNSSAPNLVHSFGFSRHLVDFAALQEFLADASEMRPPASAGRLMQRVQALSESALAAVASLVTTAELVKLLLLCMAGSTLQQTDAAAPTGRKPDFAGEVPRSASETLDARRKPDSSCDAERLENSDKCVVCKSRTKNQVTLPCSHLAACNVCLKTSSKCPVCQEHVLATITAFIS